MSDTCEICNVREAIGTRDVDDVETSVCGYCSTEVDADGSVAVRYHSGL